MKLVRIYIGCRLRDEKTDEIATNLFGGFTRYEAVGGWKPVGLRPMVESTTVYEIAFRHWDDRAKANLAYFVEYVGRLCGQTDILVTYQEVELQEVVIDTDGSY